VHWTVTDETTTYVLERSTSSSFSPATQVYSGAAASYNQTGLDAGTYYYRVKALNSCGESEWRASSNPCRVSFWSYFTFDIRSIFFDAAGGSSSLYTTSHSFSQGPYSDLFNGASHDWTDTMDSENIGLVGNVWRMSAHIQDESTISSAGISGYNTFDSPPTTFEFTAWLSGFSMPSPEHVYTAYVGTNSASVEAILCQAFATFEHQEGTTEPLSPSVSLNGWIGTNDRSMDKRFLTEPVQLEGFAPDSESLALKIAVTEGQKCAAYYQRNAEPWELIGTMEVPASDGTLYGWYGEDASDAHPSVQAEVGVMADEPADRESQNGESGSSGGGGCLMDSPAGFGVEWLLLLMVLVLCRRRRSTSE
jgi:hypothetical protein